MKPLEHRTGNREQRSVSACGSSSSSDSNRSPSLKTGWVGPEQAQTALRCGIHVQPGFEWLSYDTYLFDIDGTLLNSRDAVHYHAFHRAVATVFGLDFRLNGVPVHGNTDLGILRAYLDSAGIAESAWGPQLSRVIDLMSADVELNAAGLRPELCPAIIELLNHLSSSGKLLGVASGNLERVGWAKLRACGLRERFSFGSFSGEREKRDDIIAFGISQAKAKLGPSARVCVVGDTPADIASAHANGIPAIAVATGIYSVEELLSHNPEMCVACCDDLLDSLEVSQQRF
jgi:phosphoglycolate phosphatase-like HAD superfamily hydrolase